ncbi:MAG: hypothetical protein HC785_21050 [Calothrix sp. CSU_2_0]|nr:hypothetical protein [Calothrix sp. CSU_2_0]
MVISIYLFGFPSSDRSSHSLSKYCQNLISGWHSTIEIRKNYTQQRAIAVKIS